MTTLTELREATKLERRRARGDAVARDLRDPRVLHEALHDLAWWERRNEETREFRLLDGLEVEEPVYPMGLLNGAVAA